MSDSPFKVFETEEDFNDFKSKNIRFGYNQHKDSFLKSIGKELGKDFDSVESLVSEFSELNEKISEGISDPTATPEYKALQDKLSQERKAKEDAISKATEIDNRYKFDSSWGEAVADLTKTGEFTIPQDKVKQLFNLDHEVSFENGKAVVKDKNGMIITDKDSNPIALNEAVAEYSKGFIKTTAQGSGGGSGDGFTTEKPSFADFKNATKAGRYGLMDELQGKAKEAGGWAEPDAPKIS